jgi:hypothetical protein
MRSDMKDHLRTRSLIMPLPGLNRHRPSDVYFTRARLGLFGLHRLCFRAGLALVARAQPGRRGALP